MKVKYIDINKESTEVKELNLDYNSDKFKILFYDSVIIKSTHTHSVKDHVDKLYFEILLQFFDEVISMEFVGVTDIKSQSTLSYFPEIRTIHIAKRNGKNGMCCEFQPMWSQMSIAFNFKDVKFISHRLSCK